MQEGKIVEQGSRDKVFNDPEQAYTKKLLSFLDRLVKAKPKLNPNYHPQPVTTPHKKDPNKVNWSDALLIRRED